MIDPTGPSSGSFRVIRGGGWFNDARGCRSAERFRTSAVERMVPASFRLTKGFVGFRLLRME